MIRVLIVDDEKLQRDLVREAIRWDELGLRVVGEAEDGRQAIELAQTLRPDVLIMDINIPFINGLDASRKIKALLPHVQVLILSAYGEFCYAQDAIRLGAIRFVLKPLDPEELTRALQAAIRNLSSMWTELEDFEELCHENWRMEREQYILSKMAGQGAAMDADGAARYAIRLGGAYVVMVLRGEPDVLEEAYEAAEELFAQFEALMNAVDLVLLLGAENADALPLRLHVLTESLLQRQVIGGISEAHERLSELGAAYTEAVAALGGACGSGIQGYAEHRLSESASMIAYSPDSFIDALRHFDQARALRLVRECFDKPEAEGSARALAYVAMSMLLSVICLLNDRGVDLSERFEGERRRLEHLSTQGRAAEMGDALVALIEESFALANAASAPSAAKKAAAARRFIEQNYASPELGLNMVAEHISANPSYLSNLFKQRCGRSITQYIAEVRMTAARQLMRDESALTVAKVAERVGYQDTYYFGKCFKKHFGVLPSKLLKD